MRYRKLLERVRSLIWRYGRAEVYWHREASMPVVRIGDSEIRQARPLDPAALIGVYTEVDERRVVEDVEAYRAEVLRRARG